MPGRHAFLLLPLLLSTATPLFAQIEQKDLPPSAGADSDLNIEILRNSAGREQEKANSGRTIEVFTKKGCGSKADLHICGQIIQDEASTSYPPAISMPGISVDFPGRGTAIVSWRGTAYCEFFPFRNLDIATTVNFLLNTQIQSGAPTDPEYNGSGYGAFGLKRTDEKAFGQEPYTPQKDYYLQSLNLTRTFPIGKSGGKKSFFMRAKAEFRLIESGVCNLNGGEMSVVFVKS